LKSMGEALFFHRRHSCSYCGPGLPALACLRPSSAMRLSRGGFTAWVDIDGEETVIYQAKTSKDDNTSISCYISSEADKASHQPRWPLQTAHPASIGSSSTSVCAGTIPPMCALSTHVAGCGRTGTSAQAHSYSPRTPGQALGALRGRRR
jgi:hypothetical protein